MEDKKNFIPFHQGNRIFPEITVKSLLIGILISFLSSSIVTYVGLYAEITAVLFFPTIVFSLIVIKIFGGNILEANFSGVIISGAESIIYAMILSVPVFILLGV